MSNKRAFIALSTAIAIGTLSAGTAARAASENDGGNETGGYVLPGSFDGVNPVYHSDVFRNNSAAMAYGFAPLRVQKHLHRR
jgi:hypothetical protein